MTAQTDLAALISAQATAATDMASALSAATTAEQQVAAGTPSEWASIAAMFAIANAQKALTTAQSAAASVSAALAASVTPPPPPPPAATPILGFYTTNNTPAAIASLAATLGVPVTGYSDSFYTAGNTWATISQYKPPIIPAGSTLLLGVDLTPNSTGLSAVAANVASFTVLAKNLIGTPTIIRLGWEFNGSWMPWGTGANGNTVAEYNPAVSLVIPAMKAANSALKFDFCCNASPTLAVLEQYYGSNGGELWDYIGGDHYDNPGGGGNASQLGAAVQLASAQGKPLSIGEWGLNGADNPTFINDMAQVILDPAAAAKTYGWPAYTVAYHSYFSADLSTNSDITQFPNSEAAFKANFG